MIGQRQETAAMTDYDEKWSAVSTAVTEWLTETYAATEITYIDKGWSGDKKYRIDTACGTKYLLRITPENFSGGIGEYSVREIWRKKQADISRMQQHLAALGVPMCKPVESGHCADGVYNLQTWIEGRDAQDVIPWLSDACQYAYGLEAGKILKTLHSVPAPADQMDWECRFNAKARRRIREYRECSVEFDGAEEFISCINANCGLLRDRPQLFIHGDYHIGNMMLEDDKLVIIGFNRYEFADPWEEFCGIVKSARISPIFASGMINGYFDGEVPTEFWRLQALYISSSILASVSEAIPFGDGEVGKALEQAEEVLGWYNNMKNPIPSWYFKGYYLQNIDGIPYKMKSGYDFDFLHEYGTVFKVFDDQDSGNICFGIRGKSQGCGEAPRYFVKYAGAPTEAYKGTPQDAVQRLKATPPLYRTLAHPRLIELLETREMGGGYAMIFKWAQGISMGRMYPEEHRRFMNLPTETRMRIFRDLLDFLEHVHRKGYVAVDFYDGSVMYTEEGNTLFCDIDLFCKKPYRNPVGRMWGSSRFMSPEEFIRGAEIDEISNVYMAGAFAFALFGGYERRLDSWTLSRKLYRVVRKSVCKKRDSRQQSIRQLIEEWEDARKEETEYSDKGEYSDGFWIY